MAKDTEKLIRQLSLISFLMANRRPVSALEIKQEVEGYSSMNEDAFARRFYADRAELESLGIALQVQKPGEGFFEAELYALPPENYYLRAIEFTDGELAALRTALSLLDGQFAYAEPLRLALQQVSWGRRNPISDEAPPVEVRLESSAGGRELSQRLAKVETAISRRKTIEFDYYSMERDEHSHRTVDPYHLVFRGGQFYLIGHSHERDAVRVFRLSRIQGKVAYATKAEHDFQPPAEFDRRDWATRADWQLGDPAETARIFISERIAWLVERDYGAFGELRPASKRDRAPGRGRIYGTAYAPGASRLLVAWVLGWRKHAQVLAPQELAEEARERARLLRERHEGEFKTAKVNARPAPEVATGRSNGRAESMIRPERFARLVTLAGLLIQAARNEAPLRVDEVTEELKISPDELREDVAVLNVVNFGGGTYVLYAEVGEETIEVDADTYGDNFARPARLLPLEAKALVAAIDLLGDHLPQANLSSARRKIVAALGHDPTDEGLQIAPGRNDSEFVELISKGITERRVLALDYYKENEDEFTRGREVEPYRLQQGSEGWYVACWDPKKEDTRHFRLDRIAKADLTRRTFERRDWVEERIENESKRWLSDGEIEDSDRARVWVSSDQVRWIRERYPVIEELADGAVVIELPYGGTDWLVREILQAAGDLVVLEPEGAREKVRKAVAEIKWAN